MPQQTDRLTWKSLIFHHAVVFLLLTHSREGQSQGNPEPSELIAALLGENITLPCHVSPAADAVNTLLEWARADLNPRFVHLSRDGEDRLSDQHSSYKGRTSVSIDGLRRGDMSLKLSKVTFSDEGTYRCFVPGFGTETNIQLVVDVFIKITDVSRGVLQCKSTGWYPEPEVFWLDGEGNLLSAGPTETVRGPDDLYTVSSRVTVEKRHNNSFTCRVQQNSTNQTREAKIRVPDDFFKEPSGSGSSAAAIISALAGVTLVLAACFVVWKRKQKRDNSKTNHAGEETTGGSDAAEQRPLMEAAERQPLKNQSKADEGINSKHEQTERSDQIEEEKQPEKFRTEVEKNVGTGSQCVMDNERQRHEVQTTEDLDNTEKETKSASEGSPDQEEKKTLGEKSEKSEDTGDREERTKSETEGQSLIEGGGQQPVGAGGEAKTDPHKVENKEPTQTESAAQSPADGGRQGDQPPAGDGTNPGLEKKKEKTKAEDGGGGDKTTSSKEKSTPQSTVDGQTGQLKDTDGHNTVDQNDKNKEAEKSTDDVTAAQSPADGGRQGDQPPEGDRTNPGLEKKKEKTKAEDGGGGDKTTSSKEKSTPQSTVDGQTGQLKDTDGHNTVEKNDKNKEAEKSTDDVTAGQGQTAGHTQHGDKTDGGRKSDEDTGSVSNGGETPSSAEMGKKTGQQTGKKPEKGQSRGEDKAVEVIKPEGNTNSVSGKTESPSSVNPKTTIESQTVREPDKSAGSRDGDKAEEDRKPDKDTGSAGNGGETPSSETNAGQQTGEESQKSPESRDGDKDKTSGGDATTPGPTSTEDGKSGDNSQRVNDAKNGGEDTDALSNKPGSQNGLDRGQEQEDEDKKSNDGSSV